MRLNAATVYTLLAATQVLASPALIMRSATELVAAQADDALSARAWKDRTPNEDDASPPNEFSTVKPAKRFTSLESSTVAGGRQMLSPQEIAVWGDGR